MDYSQLPRLTLSSSGLTLATPSTSSSSSVLPLDGSESGEDGEKAPVSAFGKMKVAQLPSKKAAVFDQMEAGDELAMEGPTMEGFEDYMRLKRAKIQRQYQFVEEVSSQDHKADKDLFSGLTAFISTSIYIEATETLLAHQQKTAIDFKYLARLWMIHGGVLTQNIANGATTHFVNSFLPIYFLRDLDKIQSKMRLVTPHWILDCVAQNKRLSTFPYHLQVVDAQGVATSNQTTLNFAPQKSIGATNRSLIPTSPNTMDIDEAQPDLDETVPLIDRSLPDVQPVPDEAEDEYDPYEDMNEEIGPHRMRTSAENPNFVADYFVSSRLHHLASWKIKFQEELELHLLSLSKGQQKKDVDSRKGKRSKKSSEKTKSVRESMLDSLDDDAIEKHKLIEPMLVHIDMDAFFVSVATRNRPDLKERPVAISHGGARASCASVNYAARKLGIGNGWRVAEAQRICKEAGAPELVILPYDFSAYEEVSRAAHEIFVQHTPNVIIKSCDEAILDLTGQCSTREEAKQVVSAIREQVFAKTGCTCSAGIGSSLVLARFALKQAKPNGMAIAPSWYELAATSEDPDHFHTSPLPPAIIRLDSSFRQGSISVDIYQQELIKLFMGHPVPGGIPSSSPPTYSSPINNANISPLAYLAPFDLSELPGMGWRTRPKFGDASKISDVQQMSIESLRLLLGHKVGANMYLAARGLDSKLLGKTGERKSISVDLSYGVRFNNYEQVSKFIVDVCEVLNKRCQKAGLVGKTVTVKLWVRHPDAKPTTFLGHGYANTFSKSAPLGMPTMQADKIATVADKLVQSFAFDAEELRGLGIQLSNLSRPSSSSHSITKMFQTALSKGDPPSNLTEKSTTKTNTDNTSDPNQMAPVLHSAVPPQETAPANAENPKKRMRTIDALMTKKLAKSNKKQKKIEREVIVISPSPPRPSEAAIAPKEVVPIYPQVNAALKLKADSILSMRGPPDPSEADLQILSSFSTDLLRTRNLEEVHLFCKRVISRLCTPEWSPHVLELVHSVQKEILQNFGFPLSLPSVITLPTYSPS